MEWCGLDGAVERLTYGHDGEVLDAFRRFASGPRAGDGPGGDGPDEPSTRRRVQAEPAEPVSAGARQRRASPNCSVAVHLSFTRRTSRRHPGSLGSAPREARSRVRSPCRGESTLAYFPASPPSCGSSPCSRPSASSPRPVVATASPARPTPPRPRAPSPTSTSVRSRAPSTVRAPRSPGRSTKRSSPSSRASPRSSSTTTASAPARARRTSPPAPPTGPARDSLVKDDEKANFDRDFLYFPTVAAPITVSYNLDGVDDLQLSQDTLAGIFMGTDHHLERPGHRRRQLRRHAPVDRHHRRRALRRFGDHVELLEVPQVRGTVGVHRRVR